MNYFKTLYTKELFLLLLTSKPRNRFELRVSYMSPVKNKIKDIDSRPKVRFQSG